MGIVTRSTEQPTAMERMANWFQRSSVLRAAAELGQEHTLDLAPNIVPARMPTRMQVVVTAVCTYCHNKGYSKGIERDAARFAVRRLRRGFSGATAARSATLRADHLADVYGPQGVA